MKPISRQELHGNWATLLLPLREDESIDLSLLEEEIEQFIRARVNGIYSNGSAGEFYAQNEEEFDAIHQLLARKCEAAGVPFQIGACHSSPQLSRLRLRRAKGLAPSAFQVVLPDWFVPSWTEIIDFLQTMATDAAPIPLVLYNPPHAKRRLTPPEFLKIAEIVPQLIGIKVPGGDDLWYEAMQPVMKRLSVFIPGHQLSHGLSRGAHGAYSNVACLTPTGAQRWYEICRRDPEEGAKWEARIQGFWFTQIAPLITEHGLANMAADKTAAVAGGWLPGLTPRLRWPYQSASSAQVSAIARAARTELGDLLMEPRLTAVKP